MKKILKVISWIIFLISVLAAANAVACTIGGVVALILFLFKVACTKLFAGFAIGYFISMLVLFIVYLVFFAYTEIEKHVRKYK